MLDRMSKKDRKAWEKAAKKFDYARMSVDWPHFPFQFPTPRPWSAIYRVMNEPHATKWANESEGRLIEAASYHWLGE